MRKKSVVRIATVVMAVFICGGAVTVQNLFSSKIAMRVGEQLPNASGINASMPLIDLPGNLTSDSIKAVNIKIDEYKPSGSGLRASFEIDAREIKKSGPTQVGFLNVTSTIPAATILHSAEFSDEQIVGNTLQVSTGASGLGKAILIPKISGNQIYFALKSISIFGSEIPASSLPTEVQNQIKDKSVRELNIPKGMKLKSVSLSSKGLSVNFRGTNIQLGRLGILLKEKP